MISNDDHVFGQTGPESLATPQEEQWLGDALMNLVGFVLRFGVCGVSKYEVFTDPTKRGPDSAAPTRNISVSLI